MHCVQTLFDTSGMLLIFIYYSMCTLLLYTDYIFRKVLSQLVFLLIVFVFLIDHFNGLCTIVTCIAFLLTRKARCLKLFYQLINEQPCLLFFFFHPNQALQRRGVNYPSREQRRELCCTSALYLKLCGLLTASLQSLNPLRTPPSTLGLSL